MVQGLKYDRLVQRIQADVVVALKKAEESMAAAK